MDMCQRRGFEARMQGPIQGSDSLTLNLYYIVIPSLLVY